MFGQICLHAFLCAFTIRRKFAMTNAAEAGTSGIVDLDSSLYKDYTRFDGFIRSK